METKSIIILGTGGSAKFCDFNTKNGEPIPNGEVYGVNGTYTMPRIMPKKLRRFYSQDKLFMTDSLFSHEYGTLNFDIKAYNRFAKKYNCELISLNKMKLGKYKMNAKRYPYKKVSEYFGTEYFTDTICYMIAYALYDNTELGMLSNGVIRPELKQPLVLRLFGIDMATTREFQQSKGGVEFWLGVAMGLGCEVYVAPGGTIMKPPCMVPYGHWNRLKITKKKHDPLGLMKGKQLTGKEVYEIADRMENEERNRDRKPKRDTGN